MASKYIHKLKRNSAPAADDITAEHLIYSADSDIIRHNTNDNMLTFFYVFGFVLCLIILLLIPIPKKAGYDTSVPKKMDINSYFFFFFLPGRYFFFS